MKSSLKGAVVVITGASSGVGRAASLAFAEAGAHLVLAARRPAALEAAAAECRALGVEALAVPTDVSDAAAVDRLAEAALYRFGRIDVWINAAAVLHFGRFDETPAAVLDRVVETNITGCFHGARAALEVFRATSAGVLINTSSVLGLVGHPYCAAYAASKFAVRGLTQSLRAEVAHQPGVKVCALLPSAMDTPVYARAANFTGRRVRPIRPLYSPELAARALVSLARRPRPHAYVGGFARLTAFGAAFAPRLTQAIVRLAAEGWELDRTPAPATAGNLFRPIDDGRAVEGGWSRRYHLRTQKAAAAAALAAVGALLVVRRLRRA